MTIPATTSRTPFPLRALPLLTLSALLRLGLLLYGLYQDAHSPLKYTDIDYSVFTSASLLLSRNLSPYLRPTYRYTPLLAWALYPTTWGGPWFQWGKVIFALADLLAGAATLSILGSSASKIVAASWLLNPMVAVISTRGSAEGLLAAMVTGLLWSVLRGRLVLGGILLGLATHVKIYPVIYSVSIALYLSPPSSQSPGGMTTWLRAQFTRQRLTFFLSALITFSILNIAMFALYGFPFLEHSYLYHAVRLDHRHNFSPYATLLYLVSASGEASAGGGLSAQAHRLAFLPQLLLSGALIPLALLRNEPAAQNRTRLGAVMMVQTWAFVAFNKVCTSQYFVWYVCLLPFHLAPPSSSLGDSGSRGEMRSLVLRKPALGIGLLVLWAAGQGVWLNEAYKLEFLGESTFVPGLWAASLGFFAVNIAMLCVFVADIASWGEDKRSEGKKVQ